MKTCLLITSIFCLATTVSAQDNDTPLTRSTTDEDWGIRKSMEKKKIYQGDWEFEGRFGLGYSSFFGINYELGGKMRYFLWDRVSFGVLAGTQHAGRYYKTELGLSARAYLLEFEKWSLSLNQQVSLIKTQATYGFRQTEGQTGLGLHYYLNPSVALGLHLDAGYGLDSENPQNVTNPLKTSFDITFGF